MVQINLLGLLYCTHAALPHLLRAAEDSPRRVADLVNISSVAGRETRNGSGVYNATKHGVGAFSDALRKEVTTRHVRVSLVEPGAVATELASHNRPEILQRHPAALRPASSASRRGHRRRDRLHRLRGRATSRSTRCSSGRRSRSRREHSETRPGDPDHADDRGPRASERAFRTKNPPIG